MAINSPSFQGKGCKEFSRRGGIQKKPKEIGICLQLKRAFLSNIQCGCLRGLVKEALTSNPGDDILCQGHPVAARTCSIAFVTLDEKVSPVCKRWDPDMDIAGEERPAAASSPSPRHHFIYTSAESRRLCWVGLRPEI